jgi:hypothetical protein
MKEEIKVLIKKYQEKIAYNQRLIVKYDTTGRGGACISLTGEIQAYNAVISDLKKVINK